VPNAGVTRELATRLVEVEYGDIPRELIPLAKRAVLEAVGHMVAGALRESSRQVLRYVRRIGGSPDATCLYYGDRTNVHNAALVNGAFGHGARESVVLPAAFAVAEREIADGHEVLTAFIAGWEVVLRLAAAAAPSIPHQRPLDPVATFGPFGAAVAAGKLLRFNASVMENALSCCPAQAAGTLQASVTGGESGRVVSGFASTYGLRAATMAQRGISGARDMLEGRRGFYMCIAGLNDDGTPRFDVDEILDGFGERWHVRSAASARSAADVTSTFRRDAAAAGLLPRAQDTVIDRVTHLEMQSDMTPLISNLVGGEQR
jgi:2-methylcitrate dehydratase PrpD